MKISNFKLKILLKKLLFFEPKVRSFGRLAFSSHFIRTILSGITLRALARSLFPTARSSHFVRTIIPVYSSRSAATRNFISLFLILSLFLSSVLPAYAVTFTAGMAKRDGPGPFAGAPIVQGNYDGTGTPDNLRYTSSTTLSSEFKNVYDLNQGSVVMWVTPEWNGNDGKNHYLWRQGSSGGALFKFSNNNLRFNVGGQIVDVDASTWTAGTTYNVIARWDIDNTLNGTNYLSLSVNDSHTYGVTTIPSPSTNTNFYAGASNTSLASDSVIEGLTIYRRPLFDGTYGIDVGNGDEINQIYNSGSGNDPTLITGSWDVVFALPTNSSTGALATGTGNAWTHPHASNLLYTSTTNTGGFMMNGTYTSDGWATENGDTQSLTLQPDETAGKDTRLYSYSNDITRNYGTHNILLTSSFDKALIEFDLSNISASAILNSATLYTYRNNTGTDRAWTVSVYSVASGNADWPEGTKNNATGVAGDSCWSYKDQTPGNETPWAGSAGLSTAGTDYESDVIGSFSGNQTDPIGTEYSTQLTASRVQEWFGETNTNYGILFDPSNGGTSIASSDNATAAYRPKLVVNYTAPPTVSALSTSEKIFAGGYKTTSSAANQGIYYDKTVTAGDDWVIRAIAHSDGTSIPKVILYDQTNGAEIGSLTGTTTSTRAAPNVFIFTGEAPASSTTLRVKLVNTQASGTAYWHQVEVLSNLVNKPSMETGSGDPWIPDGWAGGNLDAGDSSQSLTIVHSGSSSIQFNTGAANEVVWENPSRTVTGSKFYSTGLYTYGDGGVGFRLEGAGAQFILQNETSNDQVNSSILASWNPLYAIYRTQSTAAERISINPKSSATGNRFVDDVYQFQLTDVSLTVTPASEANSTENTDEIRVDGRDTYVQSSASSIGTTSGFVSFNFRPRHAGADSVKFAETTSDDAYVISFNGDADDYIKVYWDSANNVKMDYSMAGTTGTGTWDATSAIAANTEYAAEVAYTGSSTMTFKVGGTTRITLSSIPSAFGTAPNTVYFGSDTSGGNQGDATFSSIVFDNTAPSISLTALSPDPNNDNTPNLTGTATEAIGTVSTVEFTMDCAGGDCSGASWTACTADDATFDEAEEAFTCTTSALSDAEHTIYVRATDSNGNTTAGGSESSDTFTVDTTAPGLPGTPTTDTPTNSTTQVWVWSAATDALSGVASYAWRVLDAALTQVASGTTALLTATTNLAEGIYSFFVKAVDNATNLGSESEGSVTVDTTAPSVSVTALTPDPTSDNTPAFTGTGNGGTTILTDIEFQVDSVAGSWTDCTATDGTIDETEEDFSCTTEALADGSHTVYVRATDEAANTTAEVDYGTDSFSVDAGVPSVSLTAVSPDPTTDSTPVISGTATDTGGTISTVEFQVDATSGSWTSCSADDSNFDEAEEAFTCQLSSLSDGEHTVYVRATDNASNTSTNASDTFTVDTTAPASFDLDSPGGDTYTNSERPTFRWKATTDATAGLSKYVLEIDNPSAGSGQASGDFTIDDIPTSRTTDYETNKYLIHYENFSDSDSTNNYISVYTKSSSEWSSDSNSGQNDGKLREGRVSWKVRAVDNAGNETSSSRTLFVDRNSPKVELTQINDIPFSSTNFSTTDKTPTIFGKITDSLAGGDSTQTQDENGPKIASGPKQVEIKVEKKEGLGYKLITLYTINMDKPWWSCDGKEVADNSKQKCDKYLTFEYTSKDTLDYGTYKITLTGKDKADNPSSETTLTLNVTTLAQITTPEEKKIIEEETKPLAPEQKEKVKEELEITKPTAVEKPNVLEVVGSKIAETLANLWWGLVDTGKTTTNSLATAWSRYQAFVIGTNQKTDAFTKTIIGRAAYAVTQSLAFVGRGVGQILTAFGKTTQTLLVAVGQGIGNTAKSIGEGYNRLANNAPGVAKIILTGIGNTANFVAKAITNTLQKTGSVIASAANSVGIITTALAQNTALAMGKITNPLARVTDSITQKADRLVAKTQLTVEIYKEVWFDKEPTKILLVKVEAVTPTSAVIHWLTNHHATSAVNYGFDTSYGSKVQSSERVKEHRMELTNLEAGKTYFFEVMSQNKNYVYDAYYTLTTPSNKSAQVKGTSTEGQLLKNPLIEVIGNKNDWILVRRTPMKSAEVVAKVQVGQTFQLLKEQDGWLLIKFDGEEGWMFGEFGISTLPPQQGESWGDDGSVQTNSGRGYR